MGRTKRILVLGIGQSNFLNQLYSGIILENNDFEFFINEYKEFSKIKKAEKELPYTKFYSFDNSPMSKFGFRKTFLKFGMTKFFWKTIFFELGLGFSFKRIKNVLIDLTKKKYITDRYINPLNFDIIHFHYIVPENLREIYFLSKNTKIICSYWGSDLLRTDGLANYFYVREGLEIANGISVQTMEMAEMLYCKFGRKYQSKLKSLRFTLDTKIFNEIDNYRDEKETIATFKRKYDIPLNTITVMLGHNGFPQNNHLKMINELEKIPKHINAQFSYVIHMSYGASEDYIKKIKELETSLKLIVITDFLGIKEIALFRLCTDLFIQLPTTDALSAAMTEVLFAGKDVVVGSWLPYGFLKRIGINYFEIEEFENLPYFLASYIEKHKKLELLENRDIIIKELFPHKTTPEWIELYNRILTDV
jgi:hypothetical protein